MNRTDLAYRKTAAEGASGFGLLIAMYDTLAGDLRRTAEAERRGDLEQRSREANHAMLVVAYLEDRTRNGSDGELARKLIAFYSSLREKLVEAQVNRSPQMLEEQMARVLEIREQWQTIDHKKEPERPEILAPASSHRYPVAFAARAEQRHSSWSA